MRFESPQFQSSRSLASPRARRPASSLAPASALRRLAVGLVAVAALAVPAGASAASFTAKLSEPSHTPSVGGQKISVTVTKGKTKLSGSVNYKFLFDGQTVSTQKGHSFKNGLFTDTLLWPKEAIGHKITLDVVVTTKYGTENLDWWIQVKA
jgi:hypothetical protein